MTGDDFRRAAAGMGIPLDDEADERFEALFARIVAGNARTNLTRITERSDVFAKHFLDSLAVLPTLESRPADGPTRSVVDVGSGVGLPGLAIAIARPAWRVTLVESTARKAEFLAETAAALGLSVGVESRRAEEVGRDDANREQYDIAIARAVARMAVLAEYLLPLVRVGGIAVAMKGTDPTEEVAESDLPAFGGGVCDILRIDVPGIEGDRHFVVATKAAATPDTYPRRTGVPAKRPVVRRT